MAYRNDRNITGEIPPFRRILAHLTPDRDHAAIYFKQQLDLSRTMPWIEAERARTGKKISFLHVFLAATGRMLHLRPKLNRYVTGWRIYQRDGVFITISVKKELKDGAKLVMIKVPISPDETPESVHDKVVAMVSEGRSGETHDEKEEAFFIKIPGVILRRLVGLVLWLDRWHLLPGAFTDPDPMFTSMVAANLGSVGLEPAYHHLYEYGNCPFFAAIGAIRDTPVAAAGQVALHPALEVKYTFDERVEDGLACALSLAGQRELIEDPERFATGTTDHAGEVPR
ncbi:MAG: 2-oxo acid dehydrogenase subunit E2 [Pseudomonadota bacterium]